MLHRLRALFLTHLHSDHTVDYPNLLLYGLYSGLDDAPASLKVMGPGRRGEMEPVFTASGRQPREPEIINPGNPTPGTVDMTAYLYQAYATDINDRPEIYDRLLQAVHGLADLHGFDPAEIVVPARAASRPPLGTGVAVQGPNRVQFLLDGEALGLHSIADAVRVMGQFIPGRGSLNLADLSEETGLPVLDQRGLGFAHAGTGVAALVGGWSEPEVWGTWSAAKSCILRVKLDPVPIWPEVIEVACRAFLHDRHPRLRVVCQIGAMALQDWEFSLAAPGGQRSLLLDPTAVGLNGEVTITFTVTDPRSPADLGLNTDVRPLGIGLERMWLAA